MLIQYVRHRRWKIYCMKSKHVDAHWKTKRKKKEKYKLHLKLEKKTSLNNNIALCIHVTLSCSLLSHLLSENICYDLNFNESMLKINILCRQSSKYYVFNNIKSTLIVSTSLESHTVFNNYFSFELCMQIDCEDVNLHKIIKKYTVSVINIISWPMVSVLYWTVLKSRDEKLSFNFYFPKNYIFTVFIMADIDRLLPKSRRLLILIKKINRWYVNNYNT